VKGLFLDEKKDHVDLEGLKSTLTSSTFSEKVRLLSSFGKKEMALLYEAVEGYLPITIETLVPPHLPPLTPVIHQGRNSLPAFRTFQKRFLRPEGVSGELWGYNHQPLMKITGPGYFVAYNSEKGEVAIDYTRLPSHPPSFWPPLKSNSWGLSFFIYKGMVDLLRGITPDVTIGKAYRNGKPISAYFVMVRSLEGVEVNPPSW
jgi:hypothetical protein